MFKRRWQNLVLFYHFLEITQDIQTRYTTAKFHISLRRGRRASHFLHWSFVEKNPNFSPLTAKNRQNWQVWALLTKSSPFLSVLGNYKLYTTAKSAIPQPSSTYHLPSKFQYKNWLAILPLHNGMLNLAMVLPVWPWDISQMVQKGLDLVFSAQTRQFCWFLAFKCEYLGIFTHKFLMQKMTGYPTSF